MLNLEIDNDVLQERILSCIRRGKPSSFIRFNDGEARIVGRERFFAPEAVAYQLKRFFGDNTLSGAAVLQLGARVVQAVQGADVVGIPPADWPHDFSCARQIVEGAIGDREIATTHVDFHQGLAASDFFQTLFSITERVGLITCRDVRKYLVDVYGAKQLDVYLVPEQADGSLNGDIDRHYPEHCDWLSGVLSQLPAPQVFLVGAGICGKIYCEKIRSAGGIAIDVGSIFDLWAARFSRPYMDDALIGSYYEAQLSQRVYSQNVIRANTEISLLRKDYDVALHVLRLGQRIHPHLNEFYIREISVLLSCNEFDEALTNLAGVEDRLGVGDKLVIGRLMKWHGVTEKAVQIFAKSVSHHPTFVPAVIELCGLAMNSSNILSTLEMIELQEACKVNLKDENHELLFQYARLLGKNGEIGAASDLGRRAIELYWFNPDYFDHQIAWLRALDNSEEATKFESKLLSMKQARCTFTQN